MSKRSTGFAAAGQFGLRDVGLTDLPPAGCETILGHDALRFVAELTKQFRPRIRALLATRRQRHRASDAGETLDFLDETRAIRESDWTINDVPADLTKRTVEITGPVERKMVINALNSGADVFMADFEDATSPTWRNQVEGQRNLHDVVRRTISFEDPTRGKSYRLNEETATLLVRPRGLHLNERHMVVDGEPVPGSLFDFGLYLFWNARELLARGTGPYFYLPKLESHHEARWWNDVFVQAQSMLGIPVGTIKATVLIETLPAAFEMDEILHELKDHSAGLNCGRWDYIFSFIKVNRSRHAAALPDRGAVTMEQPFMRAYTQLLVKTCHRRGAHAMGGMAAQIPIKGDEAEGQAALEKVRADKLREVKDGHDGTWVAHPGLVSIAREVFAAHVTGDNQLDRMRDDVEVTAQDLLAVPTGPRTVDGLRHSVRVGIHYLEAWLRGSGCVPLYHLMEDAATAEICRTQIWQWRRHAVALDDGQPVQDDWLCRIIDEEMQTIAHEVGEAAFQHGRYDQARALFEELCLADEMPEFLTVPAYQLLP